MKTPIVVCDDEELIRWSLEAHLTAAGYRVFTAKNGAEALERVARHGAQLLLTDLKMPVMDGLTAMRELRASGSEIPVIILTAHGGVEAAIEATRLGATTYLQKPFELEDVASAVKRALAHEQLRHGRDHPPSHKGYGEFIGAAPVLDSLYRTLQRLESVDAPTVLITGDSGTGKDVLARAIHKKGPRRDRPFVAIDCASLPEHLIESELFGHERGAFTDAKSSKQGLFELAERGIVFLDEIGELPLNTQSKLLRALEDRTFKRVGGIRRTPMDVAILAATNRDLKKEVEEGRFREDLFFRLNVIHVPLPPLRDRREDIPLLVSMFLRTFSKRFSREIDGIDGPALERLSDYGWPGNVRELRNVVERLVLLSSGPVIRIDDLPPEIHYTSKPLSSGEFILPDDGIDLAAVERSFIEQALGRTHKNQSAAARLLGISRYALRYRMEKFELR